MDFYVTDLKLFAMSYILISWTFEFSADQQVQFFRILILLNRFFAIISTNFYQIHMRFFPIVENILHSEKGREEALAMAIMPLFPLRAARDQNSPPHQK